MRSSSKPPPAGVLHNYVGWDLAPGNPLVEALPGLPAALAKGWIPPIRPMAEYRVIDGIRETGALRVGLEPKYPPFTRLPDKSHPRPCPAGPRIRLQLGREPLRSYRVLGRGRGALPRAFRGPPANPGTRRNGASGRANGLVHSACDQRIVGREDVGKCSGPAFEGLW
jgi:hypothetical protein